jgi:hypothetical protein
MTNLRRSWFRLGWRSLTRPVHYPPFPNASCSAVQQGGCNPCHQKTTVHMRVTAIISGDVPKKPIPLPPITVIAVVNHVSEDGPAEENDLHDSAHHSHKGSGLEIVAAEHGAAAKEVDGRHSARYCFFISCAGGRFLVFCNNVDCFAFEIANFCDNPTSSKQAFFAFATGFLSSSRSLAKEKHGKI